MLACVEPTPERPDDSETRESVLLGDSTVEVLPDAPRVYDPWTVHTLTITLSEGEVASLRAAPTEWVVGELLFDEHPLADVGVRLKGSSSFQPIDQKPAWKLKMDEFVPGQRLLGLERMTLNNEVWDPTMMAETMAYWTFRENGSLAPRTSYVAVTLNDRYLGLYTLIESMDEGFLHANDLDGSIWEMTRNCDFTGDCSCFEEQEGPAALTSIAQGCESTDAFDQEALVAFLAVEQAVNHPDSYSWNLNNFFVVHDEASNALSLSPWGADSTFIYAYPPDKPNPDCEPLHLDVDSRSSKGALRAWCRADADCNAQYEDKLLQIADWMDQVDLAGEMSRNAELLQPWEELETHVNWTMEDRRARIDCFEQWAAQRPAELRGL